MKFDLNNSFEENSRLFQAAVDKLDAECAKILFDHLDLLDPGSDSTVTRARILSFNQAIAAALDALQQHAEDDAS